MVRIYGAKAEARNFLGRSIRGHKCGDVWRTQVTNLRYSRLKICATVRGELGGAAAPALPGNSGPKSLKAYIGFIRLT